MGALCMFRKGDTLASVSLKIEGAAMSLRKVALRHFILANEIFRMARDLACQCCLFCCFMSA